jgi:hypothetical protein
MILAALFLAAQAPPPAPPAPPRTYTIIGPGSTSCPDWIIARDQGGESANVKLAWLAGFLTAHNALFGLRHGPSNVLAGTDMDHAAGWIDDYCTSNPGDNLAFAAQGLVTKLVLDQRARRR